MNSGWEKLVSHLGGDFQWTLRNIEPEPEQVVEAGNGKLRKFAGRS